MTLHIINIQKMLAEKHTDFKTNLKREMEKKTTGTWISGPMGTHFEFELIDSLDAECPEMEYSQEKPDQEIQSQNHRIDVPMFLLEESMAENQDVETSPPDRESVAEIQDMKKRKNEERKSSQEIIDCELNFTAASYSAEPGQTVTVEWDNTKFNGDEVYISLFSEWGATCHMIAFTDNDGSFDVELPTDLDPDLEYHFYIESAENNERTTICWDYALPEVTPMTCELDFIGHGFSFMHVNTPDQRNGFGLPKKTMKMFS